MTITNKYLNSKNTLNRATDYHFTKRKSSSFLTQRQQKISVITGCILNHFYYYCSGPIKNPKHYTAWNIKLELWYPNKLQLESINFLLVFRIILLPKNFSYSESPLKECVLSRAICKHVSLPTLRSRFWSKIIWMVSYSLGMLHF